MTSHPFPISRSLQKPIFMKSANPTPVWFCDARSKIECETCGIPHLAKNERDAPNFLYTTLDRTACAALFFEESRMKFREPTKLHRKSGGVGHPAIFPGLSFYGWAEAGPFFGVAR